MGLGRGAKSLSPLCGLLSPSCAKGPGGDVSLYSCLVAAAWGAHVRNAGRGGSDTGREGGRPESSGSRCTNAPAELFARRAGKGASLLGALTLAPCILCPYLCVAPFYPSPSEASPGCAGLRALSGPK